MKDFHPSCTKDHRIFNSEGEKVICAGNCELFNRTIIGEKYYRRSRLWNEPYQDEELDNLNNKFPTNNKDKHNNNDTHNDDHINNLNFNKEDGSNNNRNNNNNSINNNNQDLGNVIDNFLEKITCRIEGIHAKNTNNLKIYIQNSISDELDSLKKNIQENIKETIKQELKVMTELWTKELNLIKNTQLTNLDFHNKRSDITDGSSKNEYIKKSLEQVVIIPSKKQKSDITINQLKSNVDIVELGVGVNKLKTRTDGVVILEVEEEREKEVLVTEIQKKLGHNYKVNTNSKRNPKLKITGLEDNLINNESDIFINNLIKQNNINIVNSIKDEVKLLKRYKNNKGFGSAVLEVTPIIHEKIMNNDTIKLGWKNYKVYNHVNVTRCFNCWGFNHYAIKCTRKIICRICADNHKEEDCKSSVQKCINCENWANKYQLTEWKTDHTATNVNCECYKKIPREEARTLKKQ